MHIDTININNNNKSNICTSNILIESSLVAPSTTKAPREAATRTMPMLRTTIGTLALAR
jgi:hypothetical protein